MRLPNFLMVVGGLTWLTGELIGVIRHRGRNTTSEWVWWAQAKVPMLRWVTIGLFVDLTVHLGWHTDLLPWKWF